MTTQINTMVLLPEPPTEDQRQIRNQTFNRARWLIIIGLSGTVIGSIDVIRPQAYCPQGHSTRINATHCQRGLNSTDVVDVLPRDDFVYILCVTLLVLGSLILIMGLVNMAGLMLKK